MHVQQLRALHLLPEKRRIFLPKLSQMQETSQNHKRRLRQLLSHSLQDLHFSELPIQTERRIRRNDHQIRRTQQNNRPIQDEPKWHPDLRNR